MGTASIVLISYFSCGLLFLILFDITTKRIRTKLGAVTLETQLRMAGANAPLGPKAALAMFAVVTLLFWPAVLIGAATDAKGGDDHGKKEPGTDSEDRGGGGGVDSVPSVPETKEHAEQPAGSQGREAGQP